MHSFFMAAMLKFLYLLFDEENFIHNANSPSLSAGSDGAGAAATEHNEYVFSTEGHPFPILRGMHERFCDMSSSSSRLSSSSSEREHQNQHRDPLAESALHKSPCSLFA